MVEDDRPVQPAANDMPETWLDERIFDGKALRARLVVPPRGITDTIVVTFKGRRVRQALQSRGFGEEFLLKRGVPAIHVTADSHHWYQTEEIAALLPVLQRVTRGYRHVINYGSSMGAHAALLFSKPLRAGRTVALSPLYSVDPAQLPWERRWLEDLPSIGQFRYDMKDGIGPDAERILFYDPYSQDRRHIDLFAALPGRGIAVPMPASGHSCARFMLEAGVLTALMEPLLTRAREPFDVAHATALVRAGRRKSATYWATLSKRAMQSRWSRTALSAAQQSMALNPTHRRSANVLRAAQALQDKRDARRTARQTRSAMPGPSIPG